MISLRRSLALIKRAFLEIDSMTLTLEEGAFRVIVERVTSPELTWYLSLYKDGAPVIQHKTGDKRELFKFLQQAAKVLEP